MIYILIYNEMNNIPRDVLIKLAIEMDLPDLLSFCLTSKNINAQICDNKEFWRRKLLSEENLKNIPKSFDSKSMYIMKYLNGANLTDYIVINKILSQDGCLDQFKKENRFISIAASLFYPSIEDEGLGNYTFLYYISGPRGKYLEYLALKFEYLTRFILSELNKVPTIKFINNKPSISYTDKIDMNIRQNPQTTKPLTEMIDEAYSKLSSYYKRKADTTSYKPSKKEMNDMRKMLVEDRFADNFEIDNRCMLIVGRQLLSYLRMGKLDFTSYFI